MCMNTPMLDGVVNCLYVYTCMNTQMFSGVFNCLYVMYAYTDVDMSVHTCMNTCTHVWTEIFCSASPGVCS